MYVTGGSAAPISGNEYATVAYNAATGAQLWAQRHTGYNGGAGAATSVAVSPSSGTVYITGYAQSRVSIDDYDTVAYNATTGTQLWAKFYSVAGESYASSVAVSPTGKTVYVTGVNSSAYATVAYDAVTGTQQWSPATTAPEPAARLARWPSIPPAGRFSSPGGTTEPPQTWTTPRSLTAADLQPRRKRGLGSGRSARRAPAAPGHVTWLTLPPVTEAQE